MHRVESRIRQIPAALLPKMKNIDGTERAATEQDLLNIGIAHIEGDYYSCREQERNDLDESGEWKPLVAIPGTVISEGAVQERHANLLPQARAKIMRTRVKRTVGTGANRKEVELSLPASAVRPTDTVIDANVIPHRWAGERER